MRVGPVFVLISMVSAQIAATPVAAQMTTMPVDQSSSRPSPPIYPVPVTPLPRPVRPEIQPPRPEPVRPIIRPQPPRPPRPLPEIQPPRPLPQIQPPRPGYENNYAGYLNCRAYGSREQTCRVNTGRRVAVNRIFAGRCRANRDWSYSAYDIRVRNGCGAQFAYGYAGAYPTPLPQPMPDRDRGPSAGAVIGGVVVAAGLIALLANAKKKRNPTETAGSLTSFPPGPPATVSADLASLPSAARPSMQTCLFAAAREIGVTGGSRIRLDRLTKVEPGNGGWRFSADLTSTYPDGEHATPMYCRATPTKVIQLDFGS